METNISTVSYSLRQAEEWLVEDSKILKRQPHLFIIIPVIIIIISALFYVVFFNEASGITAMEGKEIADNLAIEWNESAELVHVMGMGQKYENGKCEKWGYSYSNNNTYIFSKGFTVTVFENGSFYIGELERPPSILSIKNWSIDSDKVVDIAKSNPNIEQWLNTYRNDDPQSIFLIALTNDTVIWEIEWSNSGFMDDPKWAQIQIDATTGEVLFVDADS